ncbi:MAG: hypothetical protein PVI79_12165 [Gammaproteobacteria bacterium]|jgi:hypothetical protein
MGIVEKLNAIGIRPGKPADILLDSHKQLLLLQDYGIDTKRDRFTEYRCLISSNTGSRKYRSPILGHTREAMLPASSLQLGIFNLLYFDRVLPLNPTEKSAPLTGFELTLFKIPEERYDLRDLVERYNLQKVYRNFLKLDDVFKIDQARLIDAYESHTYPKYRELMKIGRKAFINNWNKSHSTDQALIEVVECTDEESITEFETLMAERGQSGLR